MRTEKHKPDEHYNIYKLTLKSFANLNENWVKSPVVI